MPHREPRTFLDAKQRDVYDLVASEFAAAGLPEHQFRIFAFTMALSSIAEHRLNGKVEDLEEFTKMLSEWADESGLPDAALQRLLQRDVH